MQFTAAVLLIASFVVAPITAAHQPATPLARASLERAIAREAARMPLPASRDRTDWSRVLAITSARRLMVTVGGTRYPNRYFISADDLGILVLDLADPLIPLAARRMLIELARRDPGYFAGSAPRPIVVEGSMRMAADGVLVDGVYVATIEDVIRRFPRDDIREIRGYSGEAGTFLGDFGGLFWIAGAVGGAIAGGMIAHREFTDHKRAGALLGIVGGYVLGLLTGRTITSLIDRVDGNDDVIYRIP